MELAPVIAQIELAREIWSNENYMNYLLGLKWIWAGEVVWVAKADALKEWDLKIIANGQWDGSVNGWLNSILDIFTGKGGASLATMLETLKNTPAGQELFDKLIWDKKVKPNKKEIIKYVEIPNNNEKPKKVKNTKKINVINSK